MTQAEQDQVRELTSLLRSNDEPLWSRLRELLRGRGIDPTRAVLAECFPDDTAFEFGIVVSADGSVFQFGFDYLHSSIADGVFTEWEDLSTRSGSSPHRGSIDEARRMLAALSNREHPLQVSGDIVNTPGSEK
jgi:hypothetical protein